MMFLQCILGANMLPELYSSAKFSLNFDLRASGDFRISSMLTLPASPTSLLLVSPSSRVGF